MSWEFYVSYYQDTEQAFRDNRFTWQLRNHTLYVGNDPPEGAEPLGILYPRTGTLGGCGNHNAMNFALPPDNDWEHIANLTGDSSWSAHAMRAYFERLEHNDYLTNNSTSAAGHGFDGYIHVSTTLLPMHPFLASLRLSNKTQSQQNELDLIRRQPGYVEYLRSLILALGTDAPNSTEEVLEILSRDMNRIDSDRYETNEAFQIVVHTDSLRQRSSAQTYLRDTINERNENGTARFPLAISTSSLATKVLFDTNTGSGRPRAVGVEYMRGAALYRADRRNNGLQTSPKFNVTATREVIVAGGTFNTPQILKLSGVGPRDELASFDIPVIVDLPGVGTNMQDNYEGPVHVEAAQPFNSLFSNCTLLAPGDPCLRQWNESASGPYGLAAAPAGFLYRSTVSENADADVFFFGAAGVLFDGFYPGFSSLPPTPEAFFWSAVKMQSQNTAGTVRLRSADPQDVPEINFNYFEEGGDHDLQALSEAVQFALDIFNQTEAPYGPYKVISPDPTVDIKQGIKDRAYSHHATSSCPMGPANDTGSCVDSNFRVHGTDGLRIVDASVFPRVPGAFPILPVFMISLKAFDVILGDASS